MNWLNDREQEAAEKCLRFAKETKREYAITFAPDGEKIDEAEGTEGSVTSMTVSGGHIIHSHPDPASLSLHDIRNAYTTDGKITAITPDDGLYTADWLVAGKNDEESGELGMKVHHLAGHVLGVTDAIGEQYGWSELDRVAVEGHLINCALVAKGVLRYKFREGFVTKSKTEEFLSLLAGHEEEYARKIGDMFSQFLKEARGKNGT